MHRCHFFKCLNGHSSSKVNKLQSTLVGFLKFIHSFIHSSVYTVKCVDLKLSNKPFSSHLVSFLDLICRATLTYCIYFCFYSVLSSFPVSLVLHCTIELFLDYQLLKSFIFLACCLKKNVYISKRSLYGCVHTVLVIQRFTFRKSCTVITSELLVNEYIMSSTLKEKKKENQYLSQNVP